jgi:hypothetical protein
VKILLNKIHLCEIFLVMTMNHLNNVEQSNNTLHNR